MQSNSKQDQSTNFLKKIDSENTLLPVIRQPGLIYLPHQLSLSSAIFEVDRFCSFHGTSSAKPSVLIV